MELRDFAERVLFAATLEEKLRPPPSITDDHPGSSIVAPATPGRPRSLLFKSSGSGKADFPGTHQLEQPEQRGKLLHFFANHELLATELMALALLRFPDAPAAFRRGLLKTLQDEQEHTRLYLERMRDCGVEFGELPVSGYFWKTVSMMEHPIDYVAGLCLTFEQANLDFARHFAQSFGQVGDADTASLLDRIYHDEIGHVAYGLKWFRRWKNPGASDWDAFCQALKFPLSPQRAKGFSLNIEGRRAAGLDEHFIAELNVYSKSKGRTPNVFLFNPLAEGYIARGRSFTPVKQQSQLIRDLENLPQFLGRQDDIVLVKRKPGVQFLSELKQAGFDLPEFVELQDSETTLAPKAGRVTSCAPQNLSNPAFSELKHSKLGCLRPWAWGPDSVEILSPLFDQVAGGPNSTDRYFNNGIARLYSKAWSAEMLRLFLNQACGLDSSLREPERRHSCRPTGRESDKNVGAPKDDAPGLDCLCSEDAIGIPVDSMKDALAAIAAIRSRGHHRIVVKEAIGLAGHNAIRLWEPVILDSQVSWIEDQIAGGYQLVVEPWLDRVLDFSVQFEMTERGLKRCGFTGLINDHRGQYQANWAEPQFQKRPPARLNMLLGNAGTTPRMISNLYNKIGTMLEKELQRAGYLGPVGIDAFVYRTPDGTHQLKPIVEVNPRYTMGRLTLELMSRVAPGSHGLFQLTNRTTALRLGHDDFAALAKSLQEQHPVIVKGEPKPRIAEGVVILNDPIQAQAVLAVFHVSRTEFDPSASRLVPLPRM